MLKLEGNGLEPSEIVKELSAKYGMTERMVYKDFETRGSWQPKLQEMEKALMKVRNRHEQLFRKAVVAYLVMVAGWHAASCSSSLLHASPTGGCMGHMSGEVPLAGVASSRGRGARGKATWQVYGSTPGGACAAHLGR